MSARDDLARLLFETEKSLVGPERAAIAYADTVEQDELRRMYLDSADAILAAGWVSPADAAELQRWVDRWRRAEAATVQTLHEVQEALGPFEGRKFDVVQRATDLAAQVQRVRDRCAFWADAGDAEADIATDILTAIINDGEGEA